MRPLPRRDRPMPVASALDDAFLRGVARVVLFGLAWLSWLSIVLIAAPSRADVAGGELYGYRLGEVVERCGRSDGELGWTRVPTRTLPSPFDETWALCTPLTHEILSISARAHVDRAAALELVGELVAVLDGKYVGQDGWKHDAQSRELLGAYDEVHTFENADVLVRLSKRGDPDPGDGRRAIVELQLDRSTLAPRRDLNERAERERMEILRRAAKAKGLDRGL